VTLTFDLLILKVVSKSRVTWATSLPILVFLDLSVLDLGLSYATDRRQTSDRQTDVHGRRNRGVWGAMSPTFTTSGVQGVQGRFNENDLCFYSRQSLFTGSIAAKRQSAGIVFTQ